MAKSILIYGPSGAWKTTQIGFLARWTYERYGLKTRLISSDGGGWSPLDPLINLGIIEAWSVMQLEQPLATLRKLSRGYWPVAVGNGKMEMRPPSDNGMASVGAYGIEGLSSISETVMRALVQRGEKLGEDALYALKEGGETFYGPSRSYYGFAQRFLHEAVTNFNQLPVERVLWTALESRGQDDDTRSIVYGPMTIGRKLIKQCPAWFGDCFHAAESTASTGDGGLKTVMAYWFVRHEDPMTGIYWDAKPRVPPLKIGQLHTMFPGGFFVPTPEHGLDLYLDAQVALGQPDEELSAWKAAVDEQHKSKENT